MPMRCHQLMRCDQLEAELFDKEARREPARVSCWLWLCCGVLVALSSSFWRVAGQQDDILLMLPAWADLCVFHSLLLALAVALCIRFLWDLDSDPHVGSTPSFGAASTGAQDASLHVATTTAPALATKLAGSPLAVAVTLGAPRKADQSETAVGNGSVSPCTRRLFGLSSFGLSSMMSSRSACPSLLCAAHPSHGSAPSSDSSFHDPPVPSGQHRTTQAENVHVALRACRV